MGQKQDNLNSAWLISCVFKKVSNQGGNWFYISIIFLSKSVSIYNYSAAQSIYLAGKSVALWLQVLISDILVSLVKFSAQ